MRVGTSQYINLQIDRCTAGRLAGCLACMVARHCFKMSRALSSGSAHQATMMRAGGFDVADYHEMKFGGRIVASLEAPLARHGSCQV